MTCSATPAAEGWCGSVAAHGVRKIGAARAAENGATVAELEAIFRMAGRRDGEFVRARRRSGPSR